MFALPRPLARLVVPCLFALAFLAPMSVSASDHGGGGGAPEPMVFTLNLGLENYVQFGILFEGATPEVVAHLNTFKPRLQHQIIMLMAGKKEAELRTLQGKKDLSEQLVGIANKILGESEKTGIQEALFTKFLIQ
jgi:flagellar FliL protein